MTEVSHGEREECNREAKIAFSPFVQTSLARSGKNLGKRRRKMRYSLPFVTLVLAVVCTKATDSILKDLAAFGYELDIGLLQMLDEILTALEKEGGRTGRGKALQLGCGTGVYTDYLTTGAMRLKRRIACVDPDVKGGVFERDDGPRQFAVNILDPEDNTAKFRERLGRYNLVFTIMEPSSFPRDRHGDVANFLASSLLKGGRLVFLSDVSRTSTRTKAEWKHLFHDAGLEVDEALSAHARVACDYFMNMKGIQIFRKPGATPQII